MAEKKIALAITVGGDEDEYGRIEKYKYTVEELLKSFEISFHYIKADYKGFFAYYGIELNASEGWIERSVPMYMNFLEEL